METPNWKGLVQEWAAKCTPPLNVAYNTKRVGGKDHTPDFLCVLKVGSFQTKTHGTSLKNAEKAAAQDAVQQLRIPIPEPEDVMPELVDASESVPYEGAYVFPPQSIWASTPDDAKYINQSGQAHNGAQNGAEAAAAMLDKFTLHVLPAQNYILQVGQGRRTAMLKAHLPRGVHCIGICNEQTRRPNDRQDFPDWVTVVKNKNFFINMVFFHVGQFAARNEPVTLVSPTVSSMPQLCQLLLSAHPRLRIDVVMPQIVTE